MAQSADEKKAVEEELRLRPAATRTTATAEDVEAAAAEDPSTSTVDPNAEDTDAALDAAALQDLRRQNPRESTVDNLSSKPDLGRNDSQGIQVGAFTLRPALTETLGIERTKNGKLVTTRSYLQSAFKGSLISNWTSHELKIEAEGTWQKTLSGLSQDNPEGKIDAALRLDISNATSANFKAGYSLQREDVTDPNAISSATTQSNVEQYTATAEITRDLGLLRGTAGLDFERDTYSAAILAGGKTLSQADRNQNTGTLRGRLGFELSPALIPFVEASYGRMLYDNHKDSLGYVRDAVLYSAKLGVETDFGDKLRGELSTGYSVADFEDARLKSIAAITFDGNMTWSPQRGTDILTGLKTRIEPSTTAGASGDVAYTADVALNQVILEGLTGRLSSSITWRDYSLATTNNQTVYTAGTGLTWGLSRSLDLNADLSWEKTQQPGTTSYEVMRAGLGLTLKR